MIDEDFIAVLRATERKRAKENLEDLIERQGIDDETLRQIKKTHVMRDELCERMEKTDNVSELVELSSKITNLEYVQQQLWGFAEDCSYHRWFEVPKCLCPKTDNEEALGSPQQIVSHSCPVHFSEIVRKMCIKIENGE